MKMMVDLAKGVRRIALPKIENRDYGGMVDTV